MNDETKERDLESASEPKQNEKCFGSVGEVFQAEAELKTCSETINKNLELSAEREKTATTQYKLMLEARWTIGRTLKRMASLLKEENTKLYLEERGEPITLTAYRQKYCPKLSERMAQHYMALAKKPLGEIKKYRSMRQALLATNEITEADLDTKKGRKPHGNVSNDELVRRANSIVSKFILLNPRIEEKKLFLLFKPIGLMFMEYLWRERREHMRQQEETVQEFPKLLVDAPDISKEPSENTTTGVEASDDGKQEKEWRDKTVYETIDLCCQKIEVLLEVLLECPLPDEADQAEEEEKTYHRLEFAENHRLRHRQKKNLGERIAA